MRLFARTRLRTRLVLMALIAVLPALAVMAYDQAIDRRRARDRTLEDNLRLTRLAASQQAAAFMGAQRFLQTLAQFPGLRAKDPGDCNKLLTAVLQQHPDYLGVAVLNTDGAVFCSSSPAAISLQSGSRPWFRRVVHERTTIAGEYEIGGAPGRPDIVIAHPLLGSTGEVERVLTAVLELGHLGRLVSSVRLPQGATLTLFERHRSILARYPDAARWVGQRVPESVAIERLGPGAQETIVESAGVDGVQRLYVTVPVNAGFDTGLYVGIGIDRATAFAEASRLLRQQLWLLGFLSITVVGVAR